MRAALVNNLRGLPPGLLRTLRRDRGREMSGHERIAEKINNRPRRVLG